MDSERWHHVNELFAEALELPTADRSAWLRDACPDAEVHREVASLLAQDSKTRLERPPLELLRSAPRGDWPSHIGPYRVLTELGRGGMGCVYLAERDDTEFERQVAVKVVKRGLDTAEIVRRFRNERQILAQLKHPNVAQLYDGGTTDDGLPYFVMERVEGERIDRYCDEHRLPVRRRLELFRRVCAAVERAHQSLVVHRDLKPSNILVTPEGEPKLLDFGVAKLLDPTTPEARTQTAEALRAMTPEYASPEQVRGESVTTASDVYSLGVVLYELLTGHRPHRLESGEDAWRRTVCEEEPERPSTAVSRPVERRTLKGTEVVAEPEALSRARGEEPRRLRRILAGDLDNVVMKALAKDPGDRYGSVEQLSEDLRRHLEGLPVRARQPSLGYRTAKLVRRRAKELALAAAALAALAAFLVDRELQQRQTQRERDRAERVTEFLVELFEASDPKGVDGAEVTARDLLERGVKRLETELADEPLVRAHLLNIVGRVYLNLGPRERAGPLLREALELQRRYLDEDDPEVGETLNALAWLVFVQGDFAGAEELYREALALGRRGEGRSLMLASSLSNLGFVLGAQGRYPEAKEALEEALDLRRRHLGEEAPELADTLSHLGALYYALGEVRVAEGYVREALGIRRRLFGDEHARVGESLDYLGRLLAARGDYDEAERLFREAQGVLGRLLGEEHPKSVGVLAHLGVVLRKEGRCSEAEEALGRSLELRRRIYGAEHPMVADSLHEWGLLHECQGKMEEAEADLRQALAMDLRLLDGDHPAVAGVRVSLGQVLAGRGELVQAEEEVRQALKSFRQALPEGHADIVTAESLLGAVLTLQGRYVEAEALLLRSHNALQGDPESATVHLPAARRRLVDLYERWGKPEKADEFREPSSGI